MVAVLLGVAGLTGGPGPARQPAPQDQVALLAVCPGRQEGQLCPPVAVKSSVGVGCGCRLPAAGENPGSALALEDEEEEEGKVVPPAEPLPMGNRCGCAADARVCTCSAPPSSGQPSITAAPLSFLRAKKSCCIFKRL